MDLTLRAAQETDAQGMLGILNPIICAGVYTRMGQVISLPEQVQFIREFPEAGIFTVALWDRTQTLVGMQDVLPVEAEAGSTTGFGEISTFVDLNAHRQGIGRQLTESTLRRAREKGFEQIFATIRSSNSGAISFYRSQGFRVQADENGGDRIRLIYRLS